MMCASDKFFQLIIPFKGCCYEQFFEFGRIRSIDDPIDIGRVSLVTMHAHRNFATERMGNTLGFEDLMAKQSDIPQRLVAKHFIYPCS
ncbi:MAG: hypothetical protein WCP62_18380 [Planctomycetota bacterium]